MTSEWHPDSWKDFPANQQPEYPDLEAYEAVIAELRQQPPLVFAGEVRDLKTRLAKVAKGESFLLQGGDCAEEFSQNHGKNIREKLRILLQMAVVLVHGTLKPIVKVGRIAGQYAKPRSKPTEIVDGVEMASYRGDMVNRLEATVTSRTPNPDRMLRAYHQSASTLNLLRAFTHGGYADLSMVSAWNQEFVKNSPLGHHYEEMANAIQRNLEFIKACGIDSERFPQLHQVDLFTSHEGLLLGYESALTRVDSLTQEWYNVGAHMVWIGDRTRQLDGAHIEYMRGIKNPIGCKVGPSCDADSLLRLIEALNPDNEEGKLVLIARFGADKIDKLYPPLLRVVKEKGYNVVWSTDPMHGNTYKSDSGYKTRHFEDILKELTHFFEIHHAEGTVPGGVHFELTGDNVTECVGGAEDIKDHELVHCYETACDPRLNAKQSLEMAFLIARMLKQG
ncbi:MAG: 3-deoxy-7-phosphoheptulonate synthase class II [Acidobacteriota bacterium]|nr:3-deoxy-7-phosphoheptulonate synthase class II [Acidobacteriota bacterium]